jgi:hypothetical protein
MGRPKASPEAGILRYFREAPLSEVKFLYRIAGEEIKMRERAQPDKQIPLIPEPETPPPELQE